MNDLEKRAQEAAFVLGCEVFRDAWNALDDQCIRAWRGAQSQEERERLHMRQQALSSLRRELVKHLEDAAKTERTKDGPFRKLLSRFTNTNQ